TMTAILAREEHPPAGEKAIEWRLSTHRTAETLERVVELVDGWTGYRRRLVRLIAGFGGFLGRKHDGHPDPKAIWEGMQKVRAFAITLEAIRAAYTSSG
ncbi:MAG: IS4 family transposase, partial [Candidatus Competibacteraceae bacterium]